MRQTRLTYALAVDRHFELPAGFNPMGISVRPSKRHRHPAKGSGNIGAANAFRVMGKKWGYLVFICDFLKGFLAVEISLLLATRFQINLGLGSIIAGIMCVVGHDYPAWLGFKGGKGIATMAGVLLAIFPPLGFERSSRSSASPVSTS